MNIHFRPRDASFVSNVNTVLAATAGLLIEAVKWGSCPKPSEIGTVPLPTPFDCLLVGRFESAHNTLQLSLVQVGCRETVGDDDYT